MSKEVGTSGEITMNHLQKYRAIKNEKDSDERKERRIEELFADLKVHVDEEKQNIYVKEEIRTRERSVIKTVTYMKQREKERVQDFNFHLVRNFLSGRESAEPLVEQPSTNS